MKERLKNDMKEAMKAKDKLTLSTVRALISAIQYEEMQKGEDLKEEQYIAIFKNEVKKRKETLEFLEKADKQDEIKEANAEILVIEKYLPSQLSEAKLKEILEELKSSDANANMGLAMKHLKDNFNGQYDGKMASSLAKAMF